MDHEDGPVVSSEVPAATDEHLAAGPNGDANGNGNGHKNGNGNGNGNGNDNGTGNGNGHKNGGQKNGQGKLAGARRPERSVALPPLEHLLEAILFALDRPVTLEQLRLAIPEADDEALAAALKTLAVGYEEHGRGVRLLEIAGGWQVRTAAEYHLYVERFLVGKRRARLSRAALETLSAVAYRQPITRGDLEDLRGVDCGQVLHTLMERNLVAIRGRSANLGRPLLYGTTEDFLAYFGLTSLGDLPSLEEFRSLFGDDPLEDPEIREALLSQGLLEEAEEETERTVLLPAEPERFTAGEVERGVDLAQVAGPGEFPVDLGDADQEPAGPPAPDSPHPWEDREHGHPEGA